MFFNGGVDVSTDSGLTWTLRVTGDPRFVSAAVSADGSTLVAGSQTGYYVSTDAGATWTLRNPAWFSTVALSADGSRLVGMSTSGQVQTSSDAGVTLTKIAASTSPGASGFLSGNSGSTAELVYVGGDKWLLVALVGQLIGG